jgi:hypothetical protein
LCDVERSSILSSASDAKSPPVSGVPWTGFGIAPRNACDDLGARPLAKRQRGRRRTVTYRLLALSAIVTVTLAASVAGKEFPGRHPNPALYRALPERYRTLASSPQPDQIAFGQFRREFPKAHIVWHPYTGGAMLLSGFETRPSVDPPEKVARDFLLRWSSLLKLPEMYGLEYRETRDFFTFSLARYEQVYGPDKVPVRWAEVYVYLTRQKAVWQVFNAYVPGVFVKTPATFDAKDCLQKAKGELGIKKLRAIEKSRRVVLPQQSGDLMAHELVIPAGDPFGTWEVIADAANDCRVLASRDLVRYKDGHGRIFDPNPIVTARDGTLGPTSQIPESLYRTVTLPDISAPDTLTGLWVDTALTTARARSGSLEFLYRRPTTEFAETMAYYHITRTLRYLVGLQPRNISGTKHPFELSIRVNAFGQCMREETSCYDPDGRLITLGRGGAIPDAEDAHVILHELGHAILDQRSPGFDKTPEAQAIAEGFSDYLALTMFHEQGFESACFAPWDASEHGSGSLRCLRRASPGKPYDSIIRDSRPEAPWLNSEIWSAALWDIRNALPQKDADLLILEAHSGLPSFATTMNYLGRSLLTVDQNAFGGKYWGTIEKILDVHKIDRAKP